MNGRKHERADEGPGVESVLHHPIITEIERNEDKRGPVHETEITVPRI